MTAYYNENDAFCVAWLRNLIAAGHITPGDVDDRSITEVRPDDLRGYTQCHFFAGIGGWSYALRLAGWPDDRPVWTGSCPCQPFSSASRGRSIRRADDKHLWPAWGSLVAKCMPCTVLGEQVAQAGDWLDECCNDLEAMGYSIGAAILPACSIGQDHARARIYFAGYANRDGKSIVPINGEVVGMQKSRGFCRSVANENGVPAGVGRVYAAYGNAIVPQVAAEFIGAVMECMP